MYTFRRPAPSFGVFSFGGHRPVLICACFDIPHVSTEKPVDISLIRRQSVTGKVQDYGLRGNVNYAYIQLG